MTSFVLSVRDTNPEGRFSTGLGSPSYLAVPDGADEPLPGHALGEARVWLEAVVAGAWPEGRPVVFFVTATTPIRRSPCGASRSSSRSWSGGGSAAR